MMNAVCLQIHNLEVNDNILKWLDILLPYFQNPVSRFSVSSMVGNVFKLFPLELHMLSRMYITQIKCNSRTQYVDERKFTGLWK